MRTKIVYVLTSTTDDWYLEQTIISVFSLKKHNPSCYAILVMDKITNNSLLDSRKNILEYFDETIVINVPTQFNQVQASRYIKTSLYQYIDDNYLFIDGDTVICSDLSEIDIWPDNISAVLDLHVPLSLHKREHAVRLWANKIGWEIKSEYYYNSGVMKVMKSDVSKHLYDRWHEEWLAALDKGYPRDQPMLGKINEEMGGVIKPLADIWNCQIIENGLKFLIDAKIIHYFSSAYKNGCYCPYLFGNQEIYQKLRQNKMRFSAELEVMILNAKSQFLDQSCILSGEDTFFWENSIIRNLKKLYINHNKIYSFIESGFLLIKHPFKILNKLK